MAPPRESNVVVRMFMVSTVITNATLPKNYNWSPGTAWPPSPLFFFGTRAFQLGFQHVNPGASVKHTHVLVEERRVPLHSGGPPGRPPEGNLDVDLQTLGAASAALVEVVGVVVAGLPSPLRTCMSHQAWPEGVQSDSERVNFE